MVLGQMVACWSLLLFSWQGIGQSVLSASGVLVMIQGQMLV